MQASMAKTASTTKDVLKTVAPYLGLGGGALTGHSLATKAVPGVQRAISRHHKPSIVEHITGYPVFDDLNWPQNIRMNYYEADRINTIMKRLDPMVDHTYMPKDWVLKTLRNTPISGPLSPRGINSPEHAARVFLKALNQQELAEMGLLGAGIVGGGALGYKVLKNLSKRIK